MECSHGCQTYHAHSILFSILSEGVALWMHETTDIEGCVSGHIIVPVILEVLHTHLELHMGHKAT